MADTEFTKTAKQKEICRLANTHRHFMAYGGARSGKTAILVRNVFLRAAKRASKHLIVRFRFNHARISLGHETIPNVLAMCFPGLNVVENKADAYYTLQAEDGGESQVWLAGTDDRDRVEKILGSEYSTIYANECSQIPFEAITLLWTRLAENSGLKQRFYYDCNPPGKKHWTHKIFIEGVLPDEEKDSHGMETASCVANPYDNLENLTPEFIQALELLPKRQKQRFLDGLFLNDVEGALWTDEMISDSLCKGWNPDLRKTVIAVDPSVSHNPTSDECGIVVCSLDQDKNGVVHADHTAKLSTKMWARRVVNLYHTYEANEVVAEVNQGGDLVEDAIHHIDPHIPVVKVRASKGKFARAEPVSMLYEQKRVAHVARMPELESELTESVLMNMRESPNRLDALVWGLTHLMKPKSGSRYHIG